jgi:hypothetical protein
MGLDPVAAWVSCVTDPDPAGFGLAATPAPGYSDACMNDPLTTKARTPSRCLTGTTRWTPNAHQHRGGLDSFRWRCWANRKPVDPDVLPGRRAARRSFWGVTGSGHSHMGRGKGPSGPTPYICLVPPGADTQARTFPVPKQLAKAPWPSCTGGARRTTPFMTGELLLA